MKAGMRGQIYRLFSVLRYLFIAILIGDGDLCAAKACSAEEIAPMLSVSSTVGDLVEHPLFRVFSQRLLPKPSDTKYQSLPLSQVGRLMPYHSEFNPVDIVNGVNFIIKQSARKKRIFYDYYSKTELNSSPDKQVTGLVYYKGRPNEPFVIVIPGGGFEYVGSLHEGFPIAQAIAEQGVNAFVLIYRTGKGNRAASQDLAHAIDYITANADRLEVDINHYALWGASAGARMAANIGSYLPKNFGGISTARPDCVVMLYTSHSDYTSNDPPTYVVVGERDWIASPV